MRLRTVRDERYRYIHNFHPEIPFMARNVYKETQYPVWNLLKQLHAEGKLTPPQDAMCQPTMPAEELYDMQEDPFQLNNLVTSTKPEHQATLKRLSGVLDQWIIDINDKGRTPESPEVLRMVENEKTKPKGKGKNKKA
jgi:hypothetical protein